MLNGRPMRYVPGIAPTPYAARVQLALSRRLELDVATGICHYCGEPHVRRGRQAYCSTECQTFARRARQRLPEVEHVCERCGDLYIAARVDARYCSTRCRVAACRARAAA